jgi:hypothetical protein
LIVYGRLFNCDVWHIFSLLASLKEGGDVLVIYDVKKLASHPETRAAPPDGLGVFRSRD